MTAICVYCSSSNAVDPSYFELACSLGTALGERGHTLVFGGTDIGLMGALAHAAKLAGSRVVGVIPELARGTPFVFPADETIFTPDLRSRKAIMADRADAFVALPGGFGTLEELLEMITLKQLKFHGKPIAMLDHRGFWTPLAALFEHVYRERFASAEHHRQLYAIAPTLDAVFGYLADYRPPEIPLRWS
nr:TIGR00730 family Rossman fold protein [Kofleriaceae bacterium]